MPYYLKQEIYQTQLRVSEEPLDGFALVPDTAVPQVLDALANNFQFRVVGDAVELAPGTPPSPFSVYDFVARQWYDPRSDQQKYDQQATDMRNERDARLLQSDWTDTASAPARLGEPLYTQWQAYRQALRDVTKQPGFPFNVVWPTPPQ